MKKYRNKFILNIGGIEWKREKWGFFAAKIIKYSERISVKNSVCLIADNEGIKDYLLKNYGRQSNVIEYGGDQVRPIAMKGDYIVKYPFITSKYVLVVARIQPDNNIELIINSFKGIKDYKLVIIGNWNFSHYGKKIKSCYKNEDSLILLDAIYEQDELNVVRNNAKLYLHGHSAGGTNPSLVEAMYFGLPIFCFDNIFNRYTTENKANYFKTTEELHKLLSDLQINKLKCIAADMKQIAQRRYVWEIITNKYYDLIINDNN
jgi:glycosyltransferase involved in cell wall biosynthesis